MKWFGPSWGAPVCSYAEHVETPAAPCYLCGKAFGPEDRGVTMPFFDPSDGEHTTLSACLGCFLEALGLIDTPKTV